MAPDIDPTPTDLWYSVRRYYVDAFFSEAAGRLSNDSRVLDLGGKKVRKRGQFDIGAYPLTVEYANSDPDCEPDHLCDAADVPVEKEAYDAVICAEVLEHVPHPKEVLAEAFRVLRPGGVLLLTVPFNVNIHADPHDYARYTATWLRETLDALGFVDVDVAQQGMFFTVLADMLKSFARENLWPGRAWTRRIFLTVVTWWVRTALRLESAGRFKDNAIVRGYTTGFGVKARKPQAAGPTGMESTDE